MEHRDCWRKHGLSCDTFLLYAHFLCAIFFHYSWCDVESEFLAGADGAGPMGLCDRLGQGVEHGGALEMLGARGKDAGGREATIGGRENARLTEIHIDDVTLRHFAHERRHGNDHLEKVETYLNMLAIGCFRGYLKGTDLDEPPFDYRLSGRLKEEKRWNAKGLQNG